MVIKVAHILRHYLPHEDSIEDAVRSIALQQLQNLEQQSCIITLNHSTQPNQRIAFRENIEGIDILRLPFYGSTRHPICPNILRELSKYDLIHVHGMDFLYDFFAATKWIHKRPLVVSTHAEHLDAKFESRAAQTYFNTITRLSTAAYDRVIATSDNDSEIFGKIIHKPKLSLIKNGVDTEKFSDQSAIELQPTLLYFGRWSANKRLHDSLRFFAQLREVDDRWHLIIAGRESDNTLNDLVALVESLRLEHHVTLAPNPSDDEIKDLMQQASYFFHLSDQENFGLAPIEGMSAGLTPILSDIAPFTRIIENSGIGFAFNRERNSQEAIRKLLQLHDQGEDAYAQRRLAAMEFAKGFAWTKVADHYQDVYEEIIEESLRAKQA